MGTYVYSWLIHVAVWQKPTQYCKAIILQLKKKRHLPSSARDVGSIPGQGTKTIFLSYLFIFDGTGSSLLLKLFSSCGKQGLLSSCGVWASHCGGFSYCGAWALDSWASAMVEHRFSCSKARGIFPNQGSNLCPLPWQADS